MLESRALPSGSFFGSECEIVLDVHLKSWTAGVKNHADTLLLHHHFGTSLDKVTLLHGSRKHSQITGKLCLLSIWARFLIKISLSEQASLVPHLFPPPESYRVEVLTCGDQQSQQTLVSTQGMLFPQPLWAEKPAWLAPPHSPSCQTPVLTPSYLLPANWMSGGAALAHPGHVCRRDSRQAARVTSGNSCSDLSPLPTAHF